MNDSSKEIMPILQPLHEDFPVANPDVINQSDRRPRHNSSEQPSFLRRHATEAVALTALAGVVGWQADVLINRYTAGDEAPIASQALDPAQRIALGLSPAPSTPNVSPSSLPEDLYDLNKEYREQRSAELAREHRIEAVAESPIQPVEAATPLHLTLETTARSADQLSDTARQEFPSGVPAVTIDVPLGATDGMPTGVINSQGQEAYLINPPHNLEGYYWTKRGTVLGVSRPNPEDPAYISLPEDNQVEIYGHATSVPGAQPMAFQNLKYVQLGDKFTIQTEKGTLTYVITERDTPKKKLGAIEDPILTQPMSGQVVLVACLQNPEAGQSTYAVVLRAEVAASEPNN